MDIVMALGAGEMPAWFGRLTLQKAPVRQNHNQVARTILQTVGKFISPTIQFLAFPMG